VFDGNLYVNATMVNSQEIVCVSPPHVVGRVKLQTTVLGDFGKSMSEALSFDYIERPKVFSIDPPCGPVTGMTQIKVTGQNFMNLGPNMAFCVFNNTHFMNVTIIDSTHLYCSTPKLPNNLQSLPADQMFYHVSISVDKSSTHSLDPVKFSYYFDSELSSVDQNVGPVSGGTKSTLFGKGFTHPNVCNLKVRYGAIEVTPTAVNSTFVTTVSPIVNLPGPVVLSTSGNGQNYADDIKLHFRDKENTFTYNQEVFVSGLNP
jgi:IPT/TIG domain